ncbi:MAG: MBL fold metallo-hydrolase [Acidobacteriia bacterium]|nr:MBL fold metallo-hydrolase [Terriglobia bacterium]
MKLGDFELLALSDGTFALDGGQMFGVVPKPLWEQKLPPDSRNRVRLSLTCLLVRTGQHNVLVETGIGTKFAAKYADIYGIEKTTTLPAELEKAGLRVEDIDVVINTHLHFDHCGWNTRRENGRVVPTFPRARYYIQRGEWEHAIHPTERDVASYVTEFFGPAEVQTEFLDGNQEIVPGIRVEVLPGHTRDLQCVHIESAGERACFISDLVPTRHHLPYPWIMAFDLYPMETLANRHRLLPQLAEQNALVIFPHDPDSPWARVSEESGRITATPVD